MNCEVCSTIILPSQNRVTYTQWANGLLHAYHRHADCNLLVMETRLSTKEAVDEMRKLHPLPNLWPTQS